MAQLIQGHIEHLAEEIQVLGYGQVAVQAEMLRQVADMLARLLDLAGQLETRHPDTAAGRFEHAAQQAHGSGLTSAIRPNQADDLSCAYMQVQTIHSPLIAEGFYQIDSFQQHIRIHAELLEGHVGWHADLERQVWVGNAQPHRVNG